MSSRRAMLRGGLLRLAPLLVVLTVGVLVGANADSIGGWASLALLALGAGLSALGVLLLSLREWRRPFAAASLESLLGRERLTVEREKISPRRVEIELRRRLGEWARGLSDAEGATVLFHRHAHSDYDLRIVNEDGEERDRWICLIQAKARPVLSSLRHLARAKEREDAQVAVLITVPIGWTEFEDSGLLHAAHSMEITLGTLDDLNNLLHGSHPTVEVYVEAPPAAEAPVFAPH